MRALVTGGAGFIGSNIVDALVVAGHDVVVLDDLSSGFPENIRGDVPLFRGDVANEAQRRFGYTVPAQAHLEFRAKQANRVFGEGRAPSDEALIESQPILGSIR